MFIATVVEPAEITYAWLGAITKVERDGDARYVYGKATDDSVDSDEQICDPEWARKAMADWFTTGANVRQMHATTLPPAGKGVALDSGPGGEFVRTKVVEPVAVRLVDEEVYTGYSVGIARPRIIRDARARGGRIVGGRIVELSLVDRPSNPMAKFMVAKRADVGGAVELIGKVVLPDVVKGFTHAHVHIGPGGAPHRHEHSHVNGTAPHDELHEGGAHAHGHSTEVSVADDEKQPDEGVPEPDATKVGGVECDKCHGSGKVADAECDKCHGSGMVLEKADAPFEGAAPPFGSEDAEEGDEREPDAGKAADGEPSGPPEGGKPRDEIPAADFAGRDRSFPIVTPASVSDAAQSIGRAGPDNYSHDELRSRIIAIAHRKGPDFVAALPEAWGEESERRAAKLARKAAKATARADKAEEAPWIVRRAHDFACAAYATGDVLEAYPSIEKNGVAAALGPTARQAIYAMLSSEVSEDGGAGGDAYGIYCLAKSYAALDKFLAEEVAEGGEVSGDVFLAARDELHDAFKAANPGIGDDAEASPGSLPRPSETVTPGQFRRPYLAAGHQRAAAAAAPASIPTTTHPIGADDFTRGPLTDGHAAAAKLADFHDGLAGWQPGLCRMDADGSAAFDRQPEVSFDRSRATPPGSVLDPRDDASPRPVAAPATATAPGEKVAALVVGSGAPVAKAITPEELDAAITRAVEPFLSKITRLEATIDELAAAPDLTKSAARGVTTVGLGKSAKRSDKARRGAARKAERRDFYARMARSGDPEQRLHAQDWLARRGLDPVE